MSDLIAVFLYRSRWSDDTELYAESREVTQIYPPTVIGVASRPAGETIESTKWGREEFEENVDEVAEDVRWFDEPIECDSTDGGSA